MAARDNVHRGLLRRAQVFGPAVIVVLVGLLSYAALQRSLTTRALVVHTRDVLDAAADLLGNLVTSEAAQRGYLVTHDTTYLASAPMLRGRADSALAALHRLTVDNAEQQQRLATLDRRVHERFVLLDSSVHVARTVGFGAAADVVAGNAGRTMMRDVRTLIDSVDATESRLLVHREADETRAAELISLLLLLGPLAAAILALMVNRNFDRALADRRAALSAVELANEQLQEQAVELELQADASQGAALEAELATERAEDAMHAAEASERRAERLQQATEAFGGALSLDEVANLIVNQAVAALDAHSGLLVTYDAGRDAISVIAAHNVGVARVGDTISAAMERPLCVAVRTGKPVLMEHAADAAERFAEIAPIHAGDGVQAIAAIPMLFNGLVRGSLLVRFREPREFAPADVALLLAMTRIAAESFERARLFDAEREARAAAEAANRAKAAFLASMSHELRTPLQAALGFAQLVRSGIYGEVNPQQAEVLGRVERSQTHLTRLIDDILDFARLEAGRVRVRLEPVRVDEVLADIPPLVEARARAKSLCIRIAPTDSLVVKADRHRLRQILVNLVGNAVKFTPDDGMISVDAIAGDEQVSIRVADTGPGIPADRADAVFEPFVQVDSALTRRHDGMGLGLAISRDLARAMGGDLTLEAEPGKGARFVVRLPRLDSLADLAASADAAVAASVDGEVAAGDHSS